MQRTCSICGKSFTAKRKDARTCSATCRSNKRNGAKPAEVIESPLVRATRAELEAAGKLDTRLGQQALVLAARMSGTETPGGVGTLSKELDRVVSAAIGVVPPSAQPAAGTGDEIDELKSRRDAKRAG